MTLPERHTPENGTQSDSPHAETATQHQARRYHRSKKPPVVRTYRTRPDPFAAVTDDLFQQVREAPGVTAAVLLARLQDRFPDTYPDSLLRTLQRRVLAWRRQIIVAFDGQYADEVSDGFDRLPRPLTGTVFPNQADRDSTR